MRILALLLLLFANIAISQKLKGYHVHSHNDYEQSVPFWKAFSVGVSSLEADIFLVGNELLVAHTKEGMDKERTLEKLYLKPLVHTIKMGFTLDTLQLLIDIKSEPYSTLDALISILRKYPEIIQNKAISIIISGNRPYAIDYTNYPDFISFDHQNLEPITNPKVLDKIGLISLSFKNFTEWNGKGRLTKEDYEKVSAIVNKAHAFGKPFRFWASPDSKTAWKALIDLKVDFINTDKPFECTNYLSSLAGRIHENASISEVYRPTFLSDQTNGKVDNIVLFLGDGNGLSQITATALSNNGELSLTQLKSIGLLKTASFDDFTTDSAGAATAMATGKKVPNRSIGVDAQGNRLENITELLGKAGFLSGIVTTDQITGATPAAFYAHQKDRSMEKAIQEDLIKSNLTIFASTDEALKEDDVFGSFQIISPEKMKIKDSDKIGVVFQDTDKLAIVTQQTLEHLNAMGKPFFLMVEGAKIDNYGHANEIGGVIAEGIAFDKAISKALQFADHNQNTLILVTADHETGGLTIPTGNIKQNQIEADFTTNDHTGVMVPIFAYGPKSRLFQGVYENNVLFDKILEALDLTPRD